MKKAFSLVFMFLAFALLMVGCSDSPKTVAKKYVQALSNGDVEEANKYSTSRTHVLNGFAASMINLGDNLGEDTSKSSDLKEGLESNTGSFNMTCRQPNRLHSNKGDVAKIYSKEGKDPMILKKVNGDWKVDIEK